jgi:hypothetical protein
VHIPWNAKCLVPIAWASGLTIFAGLIRLAAQEGIPLYPDSYQLMLLTRGLSQSIPVDSAMGIAGDPWAAPFYRLGYPLLAWPFSFLSDDPFLPGLVLSFAAGTATVPLMYFLALEGLRSRTAAMGAALAVAISFSSVAWSRFAMSEAPAGCMITLTLLLCVLVSRRDRRLLGILAGLSAALMVLVRLELVVLLPACVLFILMGASRQEPKAASRVRDFLLAWAVCFVALSALWGWLAQNVAEAFSLNPFFLLRAGFLGGSDGADAARLSSLTGVASFLIHEPVLVVGAAIGLTLGLRRRDKRLWPILAGLVLLLAVEIPRNDIRFLSATVPFLAYAAGLGFESLWSSGARLLRVASVRRAALLSAAFGMMVVLLLLGQVLQTEARWHPDQGYEYEVARGVEKQLTDLALGDIVVCSYSPEVYYLVSGMSAKRLSAPGLSQCTPSEPGNWRVVIIIDEAVRRHFGEILEQDVRTIAVPLFNISTEAPYLQGASAYHDLRPASAYLLD